MKKTLLLVLALVLLATIGRATRAKEDLGAYFPLKAAPEQHKPIFENQFVLVLDVSIPPGVTVPAHVHPWPAVFITLQPAHLVFRNLVGEVVRDVRPVSDPLAGPKVEWREPDSQPTSVANVDTIEMRALRIEMKLLAR